MLLKNWLRAFGQTQRRKPSDRPVAASVERMEDRSLLSVAALFVNGELFVSSDGGDSITIRQNSANKVEVLANGAILGTAPNVLTSAVTSIVIKGGDDANTIDLNQVSNVTYPSLGSIRVDAGNGDDVIVGSLFYGDSVLGGDGKDTITGQGGADTIDGGNGADSIVGGDGDDSLIGEDGSDTISGDAGNDNIFGGNHLDIISGGDGNDTIDAGQNNDTVSGGDGDDFINGMDGTDSLLGDAGNDSILGGAANDLISGGDGNDTLLGQAGVDTLNGDLGDDSLNGGDGNDVLSGNLGNDIINGAAGNDSIFGNEGDDKLVGGAGHDTLDGFFGNDTIFGQAGNDSLIGGGGNDSLDGGAGNDILESGDLVPEDVGVTISVANTSIPEGDGGTVNMTFTLTLSATSFQTISISVATADGTASNVASDYTAVNQVLTFAPGTLTQTVIVGVTGDTTFESDETVRLILSNAINARLLNQEAIGTIIEDDTAATGLFAADFTTGELFSVDPITAASTLIGSTGVTGLNDIARDANGVIYGYQAVSNNLYTIDPVTAVATLVTTVTGITAFTAEGDITFDPVNNVLYALFAGGSQELYSINPVTGVATNVGTLQAGGGNLAAASDNIQTDYLAFQGGTLYAVISDGITGTNATFNDSLLTINPANAVVTRVGPLGVALPLQLGALDYDASADNFAMLEGLSGDLFRVNRTTGAATRTGNTGITSGSAMTFGAAALSLIQTASIGDVFIAEGNQGTQTLTFTVSLSQFSLSPVSVNFSTVNGTATAGIDFVAASGLLTFAPGTTTQAVTVIVNGDFRQEANETFFLQLTNPVGTAIGDGSGVATIVDDDAGAITPDTLLGNTGDDTLIGGPAADLLNGDGGNDLIFGNGGNDTILGGSGIDTINGGDGDDSIDGQGGADVIDSGNGDDLFMWNGASSGNDTVTNASGADGVLVRLDGSSNVATIGQTPIPVGGVFGFLQISEGGATLTVDSSVAQVTVDGGAGDDTITVTNIDLVCRGSVVVRGNTGDDLLIGQNAKIGAMRLRMEGNDGNDSIVGTQGDDTLAGDAGIDRIKGGLGNDLILGGTSIDSLNGDAGNDTILGGDGTDTLVGDGADTIFGDAGNDNLRGDQGADILSGGDGDDTASGGDGNDTITGDAGNDSLLGNSALDSISGGEGDDTLDGGRNDDILNGEAGNDRIRGDHGNDSISGGGGNDTINGGDGDDAINGQAGNDRMTGADGDDFVNGGEGSDIVTGGDGDDTLLGGNGNDVILGEQGDDLINGQGSTDTLAGGQGDDTLVAAAAGEVNEQFVLSIPVQIDLKAL